MPRKKREESPTGIYHWIVRGMNKKDLFHDSRDFSFFYGLLKEYKRKYDVAVYHYCLMTNHVHLLVHCDRIERLANFSHFIQRRYAYSYCKKYRWTGSVFQRGYKSLAIDKETYLLECGRYIERNPLKAFLARHPADYPHTSFHYYANGRSDDLLEPSPAYLALSDDEEERRKMHAQYVTETRIQEEMAEKGLLVV
jgi:putative transposase